MPVRSRSSSLTAVRGEDHVTTLRMLARRHTQIAWTRNKAACRLHAIMRELVAGGIPRSVVATQAFRFLETIERVVPVAIERITLRAGHAGNVARFATAEKFAANNGTAPVERSSGNPSQKVFRLSRRGNRTMNHALHMAAVTQIRAESWPQVLRPQTRPGSHAEESAARLETTAE